MGGRLSSSFVALLVLAVLGAGVLWWQRPWEEGSAAESVESTELAEQLRSQLAAAEEAADASAWRAAFGAGAGAEAFADRSWRAREVLDVEVIEFELVSVGAAPDREDGTYSASVAVAWQGGVGRDADSSVDPVELTLRVVPSTVDPAQVDITGVEPRQGRRASAMPLWLADEVAVGHSGPVTVVSLGGADAQQALAWIGVAARQVTTLTGASAPAVLVVPESSEQTAALLGQSVEALGSTAGVATTLDGVGPSAVVLNPDEFASMDERGRQIVVTHELTHAMTGAVGSEAEPWLVEGFADWVALHEDTAPLGLSANAVLSRAAEHGVPEALPTADDLVGDARTAAYQGAWLAVVVLADQYGDEAVREVYRQVLDGATVDDALASIGSSTAELTEQWRDYVTYNASTVS
ncbi:MAG: hypothetical protein QM621_06205 [Aeromicrobium sp.]|uniref:hypothetical protein n=1 Tax=Aeromicrobium sp. TaxID=1871063 RepID=UPI0039E27194